MIETDRQKLFAAKMRFGDESRDVSSESETRPTNRLRKQTIPQSGKDLLPTLNNSNFIIVTLKSGF
jgi:hypothetical protein